MSLENGLCAPHRQEDNSDHMDASKINSARARVEQKLIYARVHLRELHAHSFPRYGEFERAHEESFLFHLLGAREAFLAELNEYYECGLARDSVTLGKLRRALKQKDRVSAEVQELYRLEMESGTWFSQAKAMRDHSTHVHAIPRTFHSGGANDGQVRLRHPVSNQEMARDFRDEFDNWFAAMVELLRTLRASAVTACNVPF